MRLVTFTSGDGGERLGALREHDSEVVDLQAAHRAAVGGEATALASMLELIDAGGRGLELANAALQELAPEAVLPARDVRLLAPLPEPRRLRDFLAFEEHLKNMNRRMKAPSPIPDLWYERPIFAKCNQFSVVGADVPVQWPPYSEQLDFELEIGCVIGATGRDIAPEQALSHIFGFTIFNDVSARDEQMREWNPMGSMKGKDFDTGNVLGPCIVTADEFGDPYDLHAVARVNGEEWGRAEAPQMYHDWGAIIAYASLSETLRAGEVLGSGTLPGCCGAEHGRFPAPGDLIELEVEGIGILRNRFGEVGG